MSKVSNSAIVPATESAIAVVSIKRIISEPYGNDEILRDLVTGYECTIPANPDDIRASCNGGQGRFSPMGKPSGTGDPNKFVIVDYRKARLNLGANYRNHLFAELYILSVEGSLRRLMVNDDFQELGSGSLRLLSFLIPLETNGKEEDIAKKKQSKTGELFDKCTHGASRNNALAFSKLSPQEKLAIPNASEWIKAQGDSSIFTRVVETSFVDEKSVVDGKEVKYFSMKFSSRAANPDNQLEQEAVLFANYIREDAKNGIFRCVTNRFLDQEDYVSALRLNGFGSVSNPTQIEGEIVDETKLLTPAF